MYNNQSMFGNLSAGYQPPRFGSMPSMGDATGNANAGRGQSGNYGQQRTQPSNGNNAASTDGGYTGPDADGYYWRGGRRYKKWGKFYTPADPMPKPPPLHFRPMPGGPNWDDDITDPSGIYDPHGFLKPKPMPEGWQTGAVSRWATNHPGTAWGILSGLGLEDDVSREMGFYDTDLGPVMDGIQDYYNHIRKLNPGWNPNPPGDNPTP